MKTARLVVLAIALSAGGVAAYLASGSDPKPTLPEPVAQLPTVEALENAISEDAGAAILTEESLQNGTIGALAHKLSEQPPWSDFPIIVLTGSGLSTATTESAVRSRAPLGNVTLLERPLRPVTLISAVRSALVARRRQYEVRDHLREEKFPHAPRLNPLRSALAKLDPAPVQQPLPPVQPLPSTTSHYTPTTPPSWGPLARTSSAIKTTSFPATAITVRCRAPT